MNHIDEKVTVKDKIYSNSLIVILSRFGYRLITFSRIFILARLLSPTDFGLFGIAMLAISAAEKLTNIGISDSIMQKTGLTRAYLGSALTLQAIKGTFIGISIILFSKQIATFLGDSSASGIIVILAISLIVRSMSNPAVVVFSKQLKFGKKTLLDLIPSVIELIVVILVAVATSSVYSLAIGTLAGATVYCLLSHSNIVMRVYPNLIKKNFQEIVGLGKWYYSTNILNFILTEGDDFFTGRNLGATKLGIYQLSYRLSNIPATEIGHLIATVSYPSYNLMKESAHRLKKYYEKILRLTIILTLPVTTIIVALSESMVIGILGDSWVGAVSIVRILAAYGMLRALGSTGGIMWISLNKPQVNTYIKTIQLVIMAITIYPLSLLLGLRGVALSVTLYNLLALISIGMILKHLKSNALEEIKYLVSRLVVALLIGTFLFYLEGKMLQLTTPLITFIALGILGAAIFIILIYMTEKNKIIRDLINIYHAKK